MEKIYSSKEVAEKLSIQPVTVRKYSTRLEEKGYVFKKDSKGWREYTLDDLRALKHLSDLRMTDKSLDECVDSVAKLYHENLSVLPTDTTLQGEDSALFAFMKKQEKFNQELMQEVKKQREYIDTRLEQRDQQLTTVLRQLSASKQKKKWYEFWK